MFQIIVSNVGTVWFGRNGKQANCAYEQYQQASQTGNGRVSSENVTLLKNGYIVREYHPLDDLAKENLAGLSLQDTVKRIKGEPTRAEIDAASLRGTEFIIAESEKSRGSK